MAEAKSFLTVRKRCLWPMALSILVLTLLAWWILRPMNPEPVYAGKNLSAWLEQYYRMKYESTYRNKNADTAPSTNSAALGEEAADALRHIGTNAIPYYLKLAETRYTPAQAKISRLHFLYRIPWLRRTFNRWGTDATYNPLKASIGFELLGPAAESAVPELIRVMRSNDNPNGRRAAAFALSFIGPGAKAAVPDLIQNLKDHSELVRDPSIRALFAICEDQQTYRWRPDCVSIMVPELIKIINDEDTDVLRVVRTLCDLGPDAKRAVPVLLPFLKSPDPQISSATMKALQRIDPEAAAKAKLNSQ